MSWPVKVQAGDCIELIAALGNYFANVVGVEERFSDDMERTLIWVKIEAGGQEGMVPINSVLRVLDPIEAIARLSE